MSSKASFLFRGGSKDLGGNPTPADDDTHEDGSIKVKAGDLLETLEPCTVRTSESLDSPSVADLPRGVTLTVHYLGEDVRRIKVATGGGITGWVSMKTRKGQPLVMRSNIRDHDFEVGGIHEVKSIGLTVRLGEALDTESVTELKCGTTVKILEIGELNRRRAKVQAGEVAGWISLSTNEGQYLVGKVGGGPSFMQSTGARQSTMRSSTIGASTNIAEGSSKELLEACKNDNLSGVKREIEPGRKSLMGGVAPPKVSVNATDIRGKTALMFSAALGHRSIVEYLLTNPECNVNGTDDMMKTALHHAMRPGAKGPSIVDTSDSTAIVKMLIGAGARLEAKDHNERTALMLASSHGAGNVVSALLEAKADASKRDGSGFTAFDLAIQADWPRNFLDLFGPKPARGSGAAGSFGYSAADDQVSPLPTPQSEPSPVPESPAAEAESPAASPQDGGDAKPKAKRKSVLVKKKPKVPVAEDPLAATPEASLATPKSGKRQSFEDLEGYDAIGSNQLMEGDVGGSLCMSLESPAQAEQGEVEEDEAGSPSSPGTKAKAKAKPKAKRKSIVGKKTAEERPLLGEEANGDEENGDGGVKEATPKRKSVVKRVTAKKKVGKEEGAVDRDDSDGASSPNRPLLGGDLRLDSLES